jgi:hypothetical protein
MVTHFYKMSLFESFPITVSMVHEVIPQTLNPLQSVKNGGVTGINKNSFICALEG